MAGMMNSHVKGKTRAEFRLCARGFAAFQRMPDDAISWRSIETRRRRGAARTIESKPAQRRR